MTQSAVEQLLQQLVHHVTGLEESSPAWESKWQQTTAILKNHRSSSTEEYLVDEIYTNLANKFMIKGHDDLAQDLTKTKDKYLNKLRHVNPSQRILSYDMLSLLLALSESPLKQTYERKQQRMEEALHTIKDWNDLVQEEPLEGSHWQSWTDIPSEDDEDDDEWDIDMDEWSAHQHQNQPKSISVQRNTNYLEQLTHELVSHSTVTGRLDQLKTRQYWNRSVASDTDFKLPDSILHDPTHLNIALRKVQFCSNAPGERRYLKEIDAMREVLFLLRGYETVVFKRTRNDNGSLADTIFYFDSTYSINHLSDQTFKGIMDTFCHHAAILYKLKRHTKRTVFVRRNGQVYQAFVVAISSALDTFEEYLAELEAKCMAKYTPGPQEIVSLLQLQETLRQSLSSFAAIFDTLNHCSVLVSSASSSVNARSVATYLLATLFNYTANAQMDGSALKYETLISVFSQTLVPYSRLLDDWIWNGSLCGDVAGEFFVKRNTGIDGVSPLYWSEGFYVDGIEANTPDCPLFTPDFTHRILLTGKTADVVNKINPTKHPNSTMKQVSFGSIFGNRFQSNSTKSSDDNIVDRSVQHIHNHRTDSSTNSARPSNPFLQYGIPHLDQQRDIMFPMKPRQDGHQLDQQALLKYEFEDCLQLYIDEPYKVSAKMLLVALQQHECIPIHLQTLSNIYLMLDNDLMHTFCERVFIQMDNKERWYDHSFINHAFAEACQISHSHTDSTKVKLKMEVIKDDPNQSRKTSLPSSYKALTIATYLNHINIDYKIPWPINNFIKPDTMKYYNQLVHLLIRIKRAKYILEKKTLLNKCTDMTPAINDIQDSGVARLYALRMRMVWFVNALWRYVMTTVLHADTKLFTDQLTKIKDADEIPILHECYLKQITDKCLLNEQSVPIKKAIIHIMDMVEQLADMFNESGMDISASLDTLELDYTRTSDFIATSLSILGRKGSLEWFDVLSTALSV
ncbi:Spc98 family-domain-containing protein [Chlamydoabsidia padenii]|nr:Spc98 family-domain-containing protein [Chlamydoabsidia padenii]